MWRRLFLICLLPALASAASRPNVLLIAVDDLKPVLGAYGDPLAKTPHLDRLAARGLRFERAYVNQAVCAASRHHLMLGRRSTSTGLYDLGAPMRAALPAAVTLTQHFMRHGWRAEGLGKILHIGHGNTGDPASWSVPMFHDRVVEYLLPENTAPGLTREEALFSNRELGRIRQLPRGAAWEAADVPDEAYADGRVAAEAVRRLQAAAQRPDQPFFLAVGFVRPHLPFCAPQRYWDLHDRAAFPLAGRTTPPAGAPPYAGKTLGEIDQFTPVPEQPPLPEALQRTLIHGYYASVSYMDAQAGRVLQALEELRLAERTIVVLWGDHGWHLGDHGMWTKHTNYEQAVRIPLVIAAPGVTAPGSRTQALAETVDLYPTLSELAGLPVPDGLDGRSLLPVLRDPQAAVKDHAYHAFPRQRRGEPVIGRAIRTARHRLVEWKRPGAAPETADLELYDYEVDPEETRNLAAEQPAVVAQLRARLAGHPEARPPFRAPGGAKRK